MGHGRLGRLRRMWRLGCKNYYAAVGPEGIGRTNRVFLQYPTVPGDGEAGAGEAAAPAFFLSSFSRSDLQLITVSYRTATLFIPNLRTPLQYRILPFAPSVPYPTVLPFNTVSYRNPLIQSTLPYPALVYSIPWLRLLHLCHHCVPAHRRHALLHAFAAAEKHD